MQQANWISLGIIVTLFACMAQRLASSMRPTIYTSAASCRHIMVLPWKCKSYLPTSRAISWTNHEKGSFLMRSSVLFWNCQISQRATVPGWYFLVFFTLPAWRNSFWGALPPTVGQSFLLTGSSLPKADVLASAAIWANCWVGNDDSDLPHILQPSCLLYPPLHLFHLLLLLSHLWGLSGWGWVMHWGGGLHPFSARALLTSWEQRTHLSLPLSSFFGVTFVLAIL